MGLAKLFGGKSRSENDYIDLGEYVHENGGHSEAASMHIRVAEIHHLEDIKAFQDYVYKGNALILDFSAIADNEVLLRRVTNSLKQVAEDTGGDIAGFGRSTLLVTPTGVKIERKKLQTS